MHLSRLLVFSLGTTLSTAAPNPQTRDSFPVPSIGESVEDYAQQLLSLFSDADITTYDTVRAFAIIAPKLALSFNADFLKAVSKTDDLPNFNSDFDPVDGLDASKVKWLIEADGRTESDPVVLYFHGGGYTFGAFPMYPALWQDVCKQFNIKSDKLSIVWADYSVAPEVTYPVFLRQAAEVYNALTKTSNNIILAGDSSGGHLALTLLRHIKYPVDSVAEVTTKPQGLVALSPWVNLYPTQNNGTWKTYGGFNFSRALGELSVPDNTTRLSSPLNMWNDYIDWTDVLPDSSKIFVSYGDQEGLKGDIQTWLEIAQLTNSDASIFRQLDGGHDDAIFNLQNSTIFEPLVNFLTLAFA